MTVPHGRVKWRKSSRSTATDTCVELAPAGLMRDSKNPTGPIIAADWSALISLVKAGKLDH